MVFLRNVRSALTVVLVATAALLLVSACGGSSSSSNRIVGDTSYSGPGSKWDVTLANDGSFSITRRADVNAVVNLTVAGSYVRLGSGFLILTVQSASGSGAPNPGDRAYALEVPGYALMLKPLDATADQMITMVESGSCPTSDINANWVMVKGDTTGGDVGADQAGRDFFGTFNFNATTEAASLAARYDLAGFTDQGLNSLGSGSCDDGIMSVGDAVMYLTSTGGAIVHIVGGDNDETNDQFIFALNQKPISDIANSNGDYAGWLFDDNEANGQKISPVSLSCASGVCTGDIVTSIDNNVVSTDSVTITLNTPDQPSTGLVTGTIMDDALNTANLACMIDVDALGSGQKIISCVGQSPGDTAKMFNVLFVSDD